MQASVQIYVRLKKKYYLVESQIQRLLETIYLLYWAVSTVDKCPRKNHKIKYVYS